MPRLPLALPLTDELVDIALPGADRAQGDYLRRPLTVRSEYEQSRFGQQTVTGQRYCDTKSQGCTTERQTIRMMQSGGRALCPRAVGASLVTGESQAHSRRWQRESHPGPTVGNDG
jgi:hypothetical protein